MTEVTLTDIELIAYLLKQGEDKKMPGTIRTKEKCPKCNKPFTSRRLDLFARTTRQFRSAFLLMSISPAGR